MNISGSYTGAGLSATLNAANEDVIITGNVTVTGDLTLNNASLVLKCLTTRYTLSATNIIFSAFQELNNITTNATILVPDSSQANGTLRDIVMATNNLMRFGDSDVTERPVIGTFRPQYRFTFTDCSLQLMYGGIDNCIFTGCTFNRCFDWTGSHNVFIACSFTESSNRTTIMVNSLTTGKYGKSSIENKFIANTFAKGSVTEEIWGVDCLGDYDSHEAAIVNVTAVNGNQVTVELVSDYAGWNVMSSNAIGKTAAAMTGTLDGKHWNITGYSGGVYTLSHSRNTTTGLSVGDKLAVANMFTDNVFAGNTLTGHASAVQSDTYPTGVSLWGFAYGNDIYGNTITNCGVGVRDGAFTIYTNKVYTGTPKNSTLRWRYHLNGGNFIHDNTMNGCFYAIAGWCMTVSTYIAATEEYGADPATDAPLVSAIMNSEFYRNTWNAGSAVMLDCYNVGWANNTATPSTLFTFDSDLGDYYLDSQTGTTYAQGYTAPAEGGRIADYYDLATNLIAATLTASGTVNISAILSGTAKSVLQASGIVPTLLDSSGTPAVVANAHGEFNANLNVEATANLVAQAIGAIEILSNVAATAVIRGDFEMYDLAINLIEQVSYPGVVILTSGKAATHVRDNLYHIN